MSVIVCAGMKRSGSVAMFQIMREIVELNDAGIADFRGRHVNTMIKKWVNDDFIHVLKYHRYRSAFEPYTDQIGAVMTIRDPRDVIVSLMNKYGYTFDRAIHSPEFRDNNISYFHWTEKIKPINLRIYTYEEFWEYRDDVINEVAYFMGFALSFPQVQAISMKWSIEANKERAKIERDPSDPEHVAKNHIHDGRPGQWKESLTDEQAAIACAACEYKEIWYPC